MQKQKSHELLMFSIPGNSTKICNYVLLLSLFIIIFQQVNATKPVSGRQLVLPPLIPDFFANDTELLIRNPIISSELSIQHILVDDIIYKIASAEEISKTRALCEIAISAILEENSWLPRGQLIMDLRNRNLIIVLIPESLAVDEASNGLYSTVDGQLGIVYKSWATLAHYKMVLLNELVTHLVVATHRRCGIEIGAKNSAESGMPFLTKKGFVDSNLQKQLEESINLGIKKIQQIKQLLQERKKIQLTAKNQKLLQSFFAAIKHYEPKVFYLPLAELGGKKGFKHAVKTGVLSHTAGYVEPGPKYPSNKPFFYGYIKNDFIVHKHTRNSHSLKGKIKGFFGDYEQVFSMMRAPTSSSPYAGLNDQIKLAELASFISELPLRLLNVVFPEFKTYQTEYLLRCSLFADTRRQKKINNLSNDHYKAAPF